MEIIQVTEKEVEKVHSIVQETVEKVFPRFYPPKVIDYFLDLHTVEKIKDALLDEHIILVRSEGELIGTGTLKENEIKRMFVLPEYQGCGWGNSILEYLETEAINSGYTQIQLHSSLSAYSLYKNKGYRQTEYNILPTEDGQVLCYYTMEKHLNKFNVSIDYNGRRFRLLSNSPNSDVDKETSFYYHQQNDVVWAEYFGGKIQKGFLIGKVDKSTGILNSTYQHINIEKDIRTGNCHSTPEKLPNGKIKLREVWEWTNGEYFRGISEIEEV